MNAEELRQRIEELKKELGDLRKVRSNHGGHKIDFMMMEIEDEIAELKSRAG